MSLIMFSTVRDITTKKKQEKGEEVEKGKRRSTINVYCLFEQSYSPTLGKMHPFYNDFVMAFEQMFSSGQQCNVNTFRQVFLFLIKGEQRELDPHLVGIPSIPKRHLATQHIYTPTLPRGSKHHFVICAEENAHYTHHHFLASTLNLLL